MSTPASSATPTTSSTSTTDSLLERLTQMECQSLRLQSQIASLVTPETLEVMAKLDGAVKQGSVAKEHHEVNPNRENDKGF